MHTKLYGPLLEQEKMVAFIAQAGIGDLKRASENVKKKRKKIANQGFQIGGGFMVAGVVGVQQIQH